MEIQQDVARRQFRIPQPTQHRADGDRADARTRLVNRCERNGQKLAYLTSSMPAFERLSAHQFSSR